MASRCHNQDWLYGRGAENLLQLLVGVLHSLLHGRGTENLLQLLVVVLGSLLALNNQPRRCMGGSISECVGTLMAPEVPVDSCSLAVTIKTCCMGAVETRCPKNNRETAAKMRGDKQLPDRHTDKEKKEANPLIWDGPAIGRPQQSANAEMY